MLSSSSDTSCGGGGGEGKQSRLRNRGLGEARRAWRSGDRPYEELRGWAGAQKTKELSEFRRRGSSSDPHCMNECNLQRLAQRRRQRDGFRVRLPRRGQAQVALQSVKPRGREARQHQVQARTCRRGPELHLAVGRGGHVHWACLLRRTQSTCAARQKPAACASPRRSQGSPPSYRCS